PQAYESLERGVLDGVAFPYDAMKGLRLGELVSYHIDFPMYVLTFYLIMNEAKYNSLPQDLQTIIDDHSGMQEAIAVGRAWDKSVSEVREYLKERSNVFITLTPEQQELWRSRAVPVIDAGIQEADKAGLPGREIYDMAVRRAAELEKK